jgi:3-phosphoshikimate 1-carboxyvinyltransferase
MSSTLAIERITGTIDASVTPPGSKSITNRALVLAALSAGSCAVRNVLRADDTAVMLDSLRSLGIALTIDDADQSVVVQGCGGAIPASEASCFVGNSGTTVRFLTAFCSVGRGVYHLDGVPRMRDRPIGPLVALLRNLGSRIDCPLREGFPPVTIRADGLPGGFARFGSEPSSQFLSAALMAAPCAKHEVRIDLDPGQTSWPYVEMTMRLMTDFGAWVELERDPRTGKPRQIIVSDHRYKQDDYTVEPDASAASYFLAVAAINPGSRIEIGGLGTTSLQGDAKFIDVLARMGCSTASKPDRLVLSGPDSLEPIDVDLADMPDMAQTLAVVCLFADGASTLRGLHTLRVKETDRVAALQNELTRLGATITVDGDTMVIEPPRIVPGATIDTYDDHRMAMSFAVAGTRADGIVIRDPQCVNKTYPRFFDDLRTVTARR